MPHGQLQLAGSSKLARSKTSQHHRPSFSSTAYALSLPPPTRPSSNNSLAFDPSLRTCLSARKQERGKSVLAKVILLWADMTVSSGQVMLLRRLWTQGLWTWVGEQSVCFLLLRFKFSREQPLTSESDEVIAEARALAGPADAKTAVGVDFGGTRVIN